MSKLVGEDGLNVLVNNAAINLKESSITNVTSENLLQTLKVNVVGPAIITKVNKINDNQCSCVVSTSDVTSTSASVLAESVLC